MPTSIDRDPDAADLVPATEPAVPQSSTRRRLLQGAAGTLVLALTPHLARGASLLAVRVWPSAEYTRVAIEHDTPLRFHYFLLQDRSPQRLVVDIQGVDFTRRFAEQIRHVDPHDPFIARMRVGQYRSGVVRLVVELKAAVSPQVFSLAPAGPYRNRLVLDLYPANAGDPLLPLLRARGEAPAPSAERVSDSRPAPSRSEPSMERPVIDTVAQPPEETANAAPSLRCRGPRARRPLVIAVDPGHGGEDPGAVGHHGHYEKTVVLSVAHHLTSLIGSRTDYRVLMTRESDYFVPLGMRVYKARRARADLFVSIHADAWIHPDAQGSSVFALSERGASSAAAAELAREQNDSDRIGGVGSGRGDPQVSQVVLDLSTSAQISDSLRFGDAVLNELGSINRLHRGYVEQAGFAVLKAPDIPSILVETAFISNPEEEARLIEQGYQRRLARAIFGGIQEYLAKNPPQDGVPLA